MIYHYHVAVGIYHVAVGIYHVATMVAIEIQRRLDTCHSASCIIHLAHKRHIKLCSKVNKNNKEQGD